MENFVGSQKPVRIIHGKRAIGVRAIEVWLYTVLLAVPWRLSMAVNSTFFLIYTIANVLFASAFLCFSNQLLYMPLYLCILIGSCSESSIYSRIHVYNDSVCIRWRPGSDCAHAQSDPGLRRIHRHKTISHEWLRGNIHRRFSQRRTITLIRLCTGVGWSDPSLIACGPRQAKKWLRTSATVCSFRSSCGIRKLSSGPLLSVHTFCSIQGFC